MLSAAKVTEIYCMTDDFAGNLCCTGKNIWLGIKYCNMFKLYVYRKHPIKYTLYS